MIRVLLTGPDWFGDLLPYCSRACKELGLDVRTFAVNEAPWLARARRREQCSSGFRSSGGRSCSGSAGRTAADWRTMSIAGWTRPSGSSRLTSCWLWSVARPDPPRGPGRGQGDGSGSLADGRPVPGRRNHSARALRLRPAVCSGRLVAGQLAILDPEPRGRTALRRRSDGLPTARAVRLESGIAFVGSSYDRLAVGLVRQDLLRPLTGLGMRVYGDPGWRTVPGFEASYAGGPIGTEEANRVYNEAAVVVNVHHTQWRLGHEPADLRHRRGGRFPGDRLAAGPRPAFQPRGRNRRLPHGRGVGGPGSPLPGRRAGPRAGGAGGPGEGGCGNTPILIGSGASYQTAAWGAVGESSPRAGAPRRRSVPSRFATSDTYAGSAPSGYDPATVCLGAAAEGYDEPTVVAPTEAALRDSAFYRSLQPDAAVVITWLGLPDVLGALKGACPWVASVADSDGQLGRARSPPRHAHPVRLPAHRLDHPSAGPQILATALPFRHGGPRQAAPRRRGTLGRHRRLQPSGAGTPGGLLPPPPSAGPDRSRRRHSVSRG